MYVGVLTEHVFMYI